MRRLLFYILILLTAATQSCFAQNMVQKESYLKDDVYALGVPDYPPFSYYEPTSRAGAIYYSAFLKPLQDIAKKNDFKLKDSPFVNIPTLENVILDIRSGKAQFFLGAYSNTKMFTGIELIYPATVSNPIHVITLPETQEKIKSAKDLANLKGVISKTEYLSDFVLRKIKPLKLTYLDSPYDTYEKLFNGEADYIIGSLYYNRIMASRYGIEQYLSYSSKPLFKIPVFVALSKLTPQMSLYEKILVAEFNKPDFGNAVKGEILRIVEEEIAKNQGIVPPAFAQHIAPATETELPATDAPGANRGGRVVEQQRQEKSIDEVLDGI